MIDADLERWAKRTPDRTLDGLIDDVWNGVAAAGAQKDQLRALAAGQAAVLVLALAAAAGGGVLAGSQIQPRAASPAFGAGLAPSQLLLGAG